MTYKKLKYHFPYIIFLMPALFSFVLFFIIPFLDSLWISMTDAYGYNTEYHFIGFSNFIRAFSDKDFLRAIGVTVHYTIFVSIFANIIALALSFLLDGNCRMKKFFRAVYFLPNLMSLIIVSFVWTFLYGSVYRSFVDWAGIPEVFQVSWLGNTRQALYSIGFTAIWQCTGYYMLIYIAALQNISKDLLEAASIDGASKFMVIWRIKLPMLFPTIVINTILLVTAGFKTYDIPMAMTSGGPAGATTTIALQIYNSGFRSNQIGYASAQSVILFLIISAISTILYILQNKKEGSIT